MGALLIPIIIESLMPIMRALEEIQARNISSPSENFQKLTSHNEQT